MNTGGQRGGRGRAFVSVKYPPGGPRPLILIARCPHHDYRLSRFTG